jgi:hypothetical protein
LAPALLRVSLTRSRRDFLRTVTNNASTPEHGRTIAMFPFQFQRFASKIENIPNFLQTNFYRQPLQMCVLNLQTFTTIINAPLIIGHPKKS